MDTTAFSGQKFDALAAHASQGENIFFLRMGKERFGELMGMETFVRVQDATGEAVPRTISSPDCADPPIRSGALESSAGTSQCGISPADSGWTAGVEP